MNTFCVCIGGDVEYDNANETEASQGNGWFNSTYSRGNHTLTTFPVNIDMTINSNVSPTQKSVNTMYWSLFSWD